jgi:hypothetical protein
MKIQVFFLIIHIYSEFTLMEMYQIMSGRNI